MACFSPKSKESQRSKEIDIMLKKEKGKKKI